MDKGVVHVYNGMLLSHNKQQNNITVSAKVCLVKAMAFPVVMYGCELDSEESWVPKFDAFELWC